MTNRAALALAGAVAAISLMAVGCSSGPTSTSSPASAGGTSADAGGAGDIPDSQVFVTFAPPGGGWSVKVPEGWARTDGGDTVTFTDKFNTIQLGTTSATAAPTADSTRASLVPELSAGPGNVADVKVTTVDRHGGQAVLTTYVTDSPPDSVTGKSVRVAVERYEFNRDGRSAVITLSGPVGADNVDPWRTVSDGFAWQ